ncbi:phosphate regulon transcriptional regulatory protein PhoB [Lachnospiraceae bacterium KM106-2]|nr:phosphate regulon transcriptional regulatory protein PhoB [Lachnospiraceae bacterium KM106-2]
MMKILVVEDEAAIRDLIAINLELVGYEVITCENGLDAKNLLDQEEVDLILLDVMIPGINGFSLITQIEKEKTPVIFVTAKASVLDRVKGLRLGADDYIVKPFETIELIARVEAALRRNQKNSNSTYRVGNVEIDRLKRIVKKGGKEVYLTAKEYDLLDLFICNKNVALTRDQILDKVWGYDYVGLTRTVDIHVQRLREKLGLKNNIKTIFKIGYRFEE